jgi:hypothetical protein
MRTMYRNAVAGSLLTAALAVAELGAAVPAGEKDVAALARRWGKPYVAARIEQR